MGKKVVLLIFVICVLLGGVAFILQQPFLSQKKIHNTSTEEKENTSLEGQCDVDSDCVPASCCHATQCVTRAEVPSCKGAICTQVCIPGSLDCNQGSCACIKNRCKAVVR